MTDIYQFKVLKATLDVSVAADFDISTFVGGNKITPYLVVFLSGQILL